MIDDDDDDDDDDDVRMGMVGVKEVAGETQYEKQLCLGLVPDLTPPHFFVNKCNIAVNSVALETALLYSSEGGYVVNINIRPTAGVAQSVKAFACRSEVEFGRPLASLAMGDSGTSSVLTRYDPCDYDLFTKVKEPLRGTRYNTRDELIRALGRSIRNINKDGRADGVRRLPNIWQK
ncbi:hypothetical protein ANN_16006 [Periplaneta americana]|uniref:Uncharacterized protein n=1 Tax=Periplaneta americana TaxID=6978 RepID=A0ABQ8SJQ5_PERAM|nr:hypothetical protein ANN_16006 [Periplaneta americana]